MFKTRKVTLGKGVAMTYNKATGEIISYTGTAKACRKLFKAEMGYEGTTEQVTRFIFWTAVLKGQELGLVNNLPEMPEGKVSQKPYHFNY